MATGIAAYCDALLLGHSRPARNAANGNERRKPKVGLMAYAMPPPSANTGKPMSPSNRYMAWETAPSFGPRKMPEATTTTSWNVSGTTGKGILILAQTIVRAIKTPAKAMSFVFITPN